MASNQITIPEGFEIEYNPNEIPEGFEIENQNQQALNSLNEVKANDPAVQELDYQNEQLANLLFSSEEIEAMKGKGKMGWVEYRSRGFVGWSDVLPVVGVAKQAYQANKVLNISKKLENGESVSDSDKEYMKDFLRKQVEIGIRDMSWSAKGANMFVQAPAFMLEFALSGGLGEAAVKGTIAAASKGATKVALSGAAKTASRIAGQQAVLVPMYATANFGERKIADGLNITAKGDMLFDSEEAENKNVSNAFKALGTGEIQVLSELSGGLLGRMASGVANTIGKVATTNVARGISATAAKVYNSLPKNVRVKLEASARVAEELGSNVKDINNKMKSQALGFHGVAEEMGEERVADILMTAFDLDNTEGYSADQWLSAIFPEPEQLLLEAGVFSIVGSSSLAARTVVNDLLDKGYSREEATNIVNNLSEIEKENMANDILGEVAINEDITEEEVAQEQEAIQLKLFGGVEEIVQTEEIMFDMVNTAGADSAEFSDAQKEWEEKGTDSKYFKNWFGDSKVVDEDGKPLVVYHGSVQTFEVFDKDKASAEGDVGAGFYFTDNEDDVNANYYDGGPDFDNKVSRLAEQIEQDEDIDYDEAKERAEAQLRGESKKYPVYLAIKNPVYIGGNKETNLFDAMDNYMPEINEEDYEDYDEFEEARYQAEEEALQTISYQIDDKLGNLLQYDDIEKAKGILFELFGEQYVTFEELKEKLNNEYFENWDTGEYVSNEVARKIVEALGYDGIIDNTVSEKFKNMGIQYGTTHYIAFNPNQIKSVDNRGTFDSGNDNIYYDVENKISKSKVTPIVIEEGSVPKFETINELKTWIKENLNLIGDITIKSNGRVVQFSNTAVARSMKGINRSDVKRDSFSKLRELVEGAVPKKQKPSDERHQGVEGQEIYYNEFIYKGKTLGIEIAVDIPKSKNAPYVFAGHKIKKASAATRDGSKELSSNRPDATNSITDIEQNLNPVETIVDKIIKGESKWGQFYTDWVDRLTPIENLVKKAEERVEVPFADNPYYQARMYAGLTENIKQQIEDKTFIKTEDGKIEITGEGFLPIIKDYVEKVKDIEPNYDVAIEDLSKYLIANRYLLDLKDREGYEATEDQKLNALKDMAELNIKYGDKINDISKIANRIYEFNRRILHNLVDSGNMSQETYDKIITDNPHHISYKRVMDEEYGVSVSANNKFTDAKSPIKKIRGSEREIQNVFVSTLEDVARILDIAERNKVAKSIANLKNVVPEYIEKVKPLMEKRTALIEVTYDAKMRRQFEEAIKFFGRTFENVKSIKTPTGYALGSYSEAEKIVRKKLGSQDRTLAHEVGHMIDYALDVENKIKKDAQIIKEITKLAEDRFASIVKLQDGEFVIEEGLNSEKYKNYAKTNKEMIANMFDLYFTSRDYLREVAPNTYKFIDGLFVDKYKFLKDIRPSSETATEKIEQDVWTPSRQKPYGNVIEYFENGKRQFVEVTKPVMEAVEGLNGQEIEFINKFLVGSASILRKGATITPEFALRNFIRDQQSATIYIDNYNPLIDMSKGLFNVLNKKLTGENEVYDEWIKSGGAFASYMELNEKSVDKALREFVGEKSGLRKIFNPLKPLEELSSIFEQATRLSMYTRSKLNGASALEAAFESREGTLDFGRSGKQGRLWNKKLPFFNASIQGTDRLIRAFKANPKVVAMKAIGTMTIPQLALAGYYLFAAPDDDRKEYLNIPQYQKDFFYCFKVGDNWIRIPKDFTLGYIFASVPERILTWLAENNKPEGKELAEMVMTLVGSASPVNNPVDMLPPILKTIIENTANWDFFRGRHIYPEYMNDLEPSQRANKYTSETAKALGEALNISPAKIDHTINSLLGSSGRYITDAGDLMINSVRQFNEEEINEKPSSLSDAPFLRGFVLRDPVGYQAVSTNEFFENYKKVSTIDKTYKKLKNNNEVEKAIEYREKHEQEINAYRRMNNFNKRIKELGKRMDKVNSNSSLSKEEKKEILQPLAQQMADTAFEANVWYGEFIKE